MKIEDRLARLEGERMAEINRLLEDADTDTLESFLELMGGAEILRPMSTEELQRLASGDPSALTPEQFAELNRPIPHEAVAALRSGRRKAGAAPPPARRRRA